MKKIEDEEVDEISEPEDPMMLSREPKDWKVWEKPPFQAAPPHKVILTM